jgi:hypothetical protein
VRPIRFLFLLAIQSCLCVTREFSELSWSLDSWNRSITEWTKIEIHSVILNSFLSYTVRSLLGTNVRHRRGLQVVAARSTVRTHRTQESFTFLRPPTSDCATQSLSGLWYLANESCVVCVLRVRRPNIHQTAHIGKKNRRRLQTNYMHPIFRSHTPP